MGVIFSDPFWGRVVVVLIMAAIAFVLWFSVDILFYVLKRDFRHVELQIVHFTRHDFTREKQARRRKGEVIFRGVDRMKIRPTIDNRLLFWALLLQALRKWKGTHILNLGAKGYATLLPIRVEHLRRIANGEYKRGAGLPFDDRRYWMCAVYDVSEDRSRYVIRCVLMQERDLIGFDQYVKKPPMNSRNFALVCKIHAAFVANTATFIDVDITAA